ncbi:hypothetical protein R6V09_06650 [Streptomyces sp. W16]|uniref:hypothetical protein n=1 Tax=Streptomyces sp. W16 TaxID=3076631 RepID=UPI00295A83BA|nr:hypothetical protein [Streptomyces sp. W16]MDV9169815.1 hypothetical protein [Streptomyces sp. W16]
MILSDWIAGIVEREFDEGSRKRLSEALSGLDVSIFDLQDPDRIAGAILILFKEGVDLDVIIDEAITDWRDLLVSAGLESDSWSTVIVDRFGLSPGL